MNFFLPKLIFSLCKKCFHVFDASNLSGDLLHLFKLLTMSFFLSGKRGVSLDFKNF